MRMIGLLLGCALLLTAAVWLFPYLSVDNSAVQPPPLQNVNISAPAVAASQPQTVSPAQTVAVTADQAKASETNELPTPADFARLDGEELVLTLDAMDQLNDAGRIDFFARQLRAEPRSDASLQAEQQLTELLQNKVQIFRRSALSRIDCGEHFCLVVAPVPQQDALFNEFQQHSKTLSFGSGGFYNFKSNGELYNGLVLSLKENTSLQ